MLLAGDLSRPPSAKELHELQTFLHDVCLPNDGMELSELDGFLTAIVSGPEFIPPSEWLPIIWGKRDIVFDTPGQAKRISGLILRRINEINADLVEDSLQPIFLQAEVGDSQSQTARKELADMWCVGYFNAILLRFNAWKPLLDAPKTEGGRLILPIFSLAAPFFEHGKLTTDEDENVIRTVLQDVALDEIAKLVPDAAYGIYDYWQENRLAQTVMPPMKAAHRPGRNDSCVCGSGKKYKKCCGKA